MNDMWTYLIDKINNAEYFSIKEFGDIINMKNSQIYYFIKKYKLNNKIKSAIYKNKKKKMIDILENKKYYSCKDIAKILYTNKDYICLLIKKYNIQDIYEKNKSNISNELKYALENEQYSSYSDLAEILKCSTSKVRTLINKYNFVDIYKLNKTTIIKKIINVLENETYYSYEHIAELVDCQPSNVASLINRYKLKELYYKNKQEKHKNRYSEIHDLIGKSKYHNFKQLASLYKYSTSHLYKLINNHDELRQFYEKNKM